MDPFVKQFQQYITAHSPEYGCCDIQSLSELLYNIYAEHNPIDNAEIRASFRKLEPIFQCLAEEEADHAFTIICRLCAQHEEAAFLQGMRVGAQIILELSIQPMSSDSPL